MGEKRKQIIFPVDGDEHQVLKELATRRGITIKKMFMDAVLKAHPEIREEIRKRKEA